MTRIIIPDKNDPHPWSVFVAESAIHRDPLVISDVVRILPHGGEVSGTVYTNPDTDEDWLATGEGFVPLTTVTRVHPGNIHSATIPIGTEIIDRWWGLPIGYIPDDLVDIPAGWCINDGKEYRLRQVALPALLDMLEAAASEGVEIRVLSSWRPGDYQRNLYMGAIERMGRNQRASAPPGHSEHQLGTVVDLCDVEEKEVLTAAFSDTPQGRWLAEHAGEFGFFRSYTDENTARTGYISEPWHWRFWGR
ncbi:MAG: M15 family metallopeptidase [Candidatus Sumerlaeia bacterium]|nr:M15 family metallopeptidase [Candidatus Sumerlaeia bacterium]